MQPNQKSAETQTQYCLWSPIKQKELESQLKGYWEQDIWNPNNNPFVDQSNENKGACIRFNGCPYELRIEIKYACYQKLSSRDWQGSTLHNNASKLNRIIEWLSIVDKSYKSLLDRDLDEWLICLRTYLIEQNKFFRKTPAKAVRKDGSIKEYAMQDACIYQFRQIYKTIQDFYDDREEFEKDIWDLRKLGFVSYSSAHHHLLNFTKISQIWIFEASKRFIKYKLGVGISGSSCRKKIDSLKIFSEFVSKKHSRIKPSDINRSIIVDYLCYLATTELTEESRLRVIADLRDFLETCSREQWANVTKEQLIYNDDYPKYKRGRKPDYIPEEVIKQIVNNLDELKNSVHQRLFLIILECGMRISEICSIAFDCLKTASDGTYFLKYYQSKMKKEITVPISLENVNLIREQQKYVVDKYGNKCLFLFPATYQKDRAMSSRAFVNSIKALIYNKNICDANGKLWHFHPHQCRHTVGTRMINSGVPQHIVQRYLGHESSTMTQVYAHIHDETLRKEIEKYHETRVVNFQGETAELEETVLASGDDLEWFKKTVQARALEHGYCARPTMLGDCDIPGFDGCYNCPHWRTNKNFLPVLKDTLERTDNVLNKARNCGWELQVKKNEPVKANLEKVIKSLEEAS